jgi:tetratricopeptide (TPR) repeat protein
MLTKARDLDPRNPNILSNYATSLLLSRRYAEADAAWSLATAISPDYAEAQASRVWLQVQWKGDLARARTLLSQAEAVAHQPDSDGRLAFAAFRVALARRDFEGALRQLDAATVPVFSSHAAFRPVDLLRSQVHALAGHTAERHRTAEAARAILEAELRERPGDERACSSLGIAFALLDRNEDALRAAHEAVGLMPVSRDAMMAQNRLEDLAVVCTMVGQHGEAIEILGDLLARSGELTPHVLRLDPCWDPLRKDPKFEALLTKFEVRRGGPESPTRR